MFCLKRAIANDAFVRVVDAFVDDIDLKSFGFSYVDCKEEDCHLFGTLKRQRGFTFTLQKSFGLYGSMLNSDELPLVGK
jgi:hypothetical protein